jgi:hypothetical protein
LAALLADTLDVLDLGLRLPLALVHIQVVGDTLGTERFDAFPRFADVGDEEVRVRWAGDVEVRSWILRLEGIVSRVSTQVRLQRCRRSTLDDLVLEDLRALRLKMYS